jgi:ELWxxDGT repeat protein
VLVRDEPGGLRPSSQVSSAAVSGNRLFFVGRDDAAGDELWSSDGTTLGTQRVKDLTPGTANTPITSLRSLGSGLVVLTAADPTFGAEAWRSDGTDLGTFVLADLAAGGIGSDPDQYVLVGQQVIFTADDRLVGREPYAMPRNAGGGASVESLGVGCARAGTDPPRLDTTSLPQLGNANLRVVLDRGEPSSPVTILLGAASASIPLGGGCTLLMAPPILATIDLGLTTSIGTALLPLPIPNSPWLVGARVVLQGVVVQPGAPFLGLVSFSQSLRLRIGR